MALRLREEEDRKTSWAAALGKVVTIIGALAIIGAFTILSGPFVLYAAIGGAVLAGLGSICYACSPSIKPQVNPQSRIVEVQIEQAAKEQVARELAEQAAKEQVARELAEQAARKQAEKQKAERQKAETQKAQKEKEEKDRIEATKKREIKQKEIAARQEVEKREKAEKAEKAAREKVEREQAEAAEKEKQKVEAKELEIKKQPEKAKKATVARAPAKEKQAAKEREKERKKEQAAAEQAAAKIRTEEKEKIQRDKELGDQKVAAEKRAKKQEEREAISKEQEIEAAAKKLVTKLIQAIREGEEKEKRKREEQAAREQAPAEAAEQAAKAEAAAEQAAKEQAAETKSSLFGALCRGGVNLATGGTAAQKMAKATAELSKYAIASLRHSMNTGIQGVNLIGSATSSPLWIYPVSEHEQKLELASQMAGDPFSAVFGARKLMTRKEKEKSPASPATVSKSKPSSAQDFPCWSVASSVVARLPGPFFALAEGTLIGSIYGLERFSHMVDSSGMTLSINEVRINMLQALKAAEVLLKVGGSQANASLIPKLSEKVTSAFQNITENISPPVINGLTLAGQTRRGIEATLKILSAVMALKKLTSWVEHFHTHQVSSSEFQQLGGGYSLNFSEFEEVARMLQVNAWIAISFNAMAAMRELSPVLLSGNPLNFRSRLDTAIQGLSTTIFDLLPPSKDWPEDSFNNRLALFRLLQSNHQSARSLVSRARTLIWDAVYRKSASIVVNLIEKPAKLMGAVMLGIGYSGWYPLDRAIPPGIFKDVNSDALLSACLMSTFIYYFSGLCLEELGGFCLEHVTKGVVRQQLNNHQGAMLSKINEITKSILMNMLFNQDEKERVENHSVNNNAVTFSPELLEQGQIVTTVMLAFLTTCIKKEREPSLSWTQKKVLGYPRVAGSVVLVTAAGCLGPMTKTLVCSQFDRILKGSAGLSLAWVIYTLYQNNNYIKKKVGYGYTVATGLYSRAQTITLNSYGLSGDYLKKEFVVSLIPTPVQQFLVNPIIAISQVFLCASLGPDYLRKTAELIVMLAAMDYTWRGNDDVLYFRLHSLLMGATLLGVFAPLLVNGVSSSPRRCLNEMSSQIRRIGSSFGASCCLFVKKPFNRTPSNPASTQSVKKQLTE